MHNTTNLPLLLFGLAIAVTASYCVVFAVADLVQSPNIRTAIRFLSTAAIVAFGCYIMWQVIRS